ncbi:hypothetical protein [Rhodococcus qingshengii]|uniref:hypothetical protein n=1 Tax=Rhodococcus qingshengii TaxID=334542 RepID=UPI001C5D378E|nr:hypothetical protein [Rhodococcus qingshengii]MBW4818162.1 hypothetical protein [Rhodococcus qingshengii]
MFGRFASGSSDRQAGALLESAITGLTIAVFVIAAVSVLFGLAAIADATYVRKTGRKPRISPNVNGPRLIVFSLTAVALVVLLRLMS